MKKISIVKITICAAFFLFFGAVFFLSPTTGNSVFKGETKDFESPQNCAACHQNAFDSRHQTTHQKTVKKASAGTIRGDFTIENKFESAEFEAEMRRDGEDFYIKIGEDSYKISAVVGVKFIEQYVGEKDGEFYSLPVAYHLTEGRWIHLNDTDFAAKSADVLRHLQNWKTDCAACHQPNGEQNSADDFQNFGISCNACHGNSAEHVAAKTSLWATLGFQTENKIVNLKKLSSDGAMLVCASCHSRDLMETPQFIKFSGDENPPELIAAHQPENSEKFWANGANKFSGNEFQAIIRSVCYAQSKAGGHGISGEKINCASCHTAHESSGDFQVSDKNYNQTCLNCHAQFADDSATAEHTKHWINSEAASCASCHQPELVFGRTRFLRTHEISVPNPILTVEKQIPNACNLCHIDQSVNWAIAASKRLWSERFLDAQISTDKQFDQPEQIRLLRSNDEFLKALAADAVRKSSAKK